MNPVIKDILVRKVSTKDKIEALNSLQKDIDLAKKYLSPEFTYCEYCDDYYLTKSFFTEKEVKEENICVYSDPINSGGNEYRMGKVEYCHHVCPKGHKFLLHKQEVKR